MSLSPLTEGQGGAMGCLAEGYPAAWVPQDDKASVMGPSQEIQFWGWESFSWAQHPSWANVTPGSHAVHALGREMPGMAPGCQILLSPVLHRSPHLPQPWAKGTCFLAWLKESRGNPIASAGMGLLVKCSRATDLLGQASLTAHHKLLCVDLNRVDKK